MSRVVLTVPAVGRVLVSTTAVALMCAAPAAHAKLDYSVAIVDGSQLVTGLYDEIADHVGAAMVDWGRYVLGSASIDVEVQITSSIPAAAASSRASAYVGDQGGYHIYGSGMAFKINQGVDVNGNAPDVEILLNPDYVRNELWFDPQPLIRQALVPQDKTDAMSVFIHEVGHALAFNGWGSHDNGSLPADYASTWDINTVFDGSGLYFTGGHAEQLYGGAVPVTLGNNYHIGNATGPGSDLLSDVMNGVSFTRGSRYDISPLDVAMIEDMGVVVQSVPEVQSIWMMAVGLLALMVRHKSAKWVRRRA